MHVQDTEEKAMQNARQFMWMQGEFTGLAHPVWANPSGYFSPSGRRGFVEFAVGRAKNPRGNPTFEQQVADTMIIAGTPDQVIERLKHLIEHTRPGIMGIWGNDGTVSAVDRRRCIELLVKEVMPAVKEHGKTAGPEGSVGSERAGASAVLDGHPGAEGRGGVRLKTGKECPYLSRTFLPGASIDYQQTDEQGADDNPAVRACGAWRRRRRRAGPLD